MVNNRFFYRVFLPLFCVLLLTPVSVMAVIVDPTLLLGAGTNPGENANKHNFSKQATHSGPKAIDDGPNSDYDTRICIYCHTPHGGTPDTPLWNRKNPVSSFNLFGEGLGGGAGLAIINDPTAQGAADYSTSQPDGYPNGATKMCLSCHDGATAIGQMANGAVIAMTQNTITDPAMTFNPTTQSSKIAGSHPVSFIYNAAVAAAINAYPSSTGTYVAPTGAAAKFWLDGNSRMQCTTCHNPHQDTRQVSNYDLPFWKNYNNDEANDYDGTCVVCHEAGTKVFGGGPLPPTSHP